MDFFGQGRSCSVWRQEIPAPTAIPSEEVSISEVLPETEVYLPSAEDLFEDQERLVSPCTIHLTLMDITLQQLDIEETASAGHTWLCVANWNSLGVGNSHRVQARVNGPTKAAFCLT